MRNYGDFRHTCNPHDNYILITGNTLRHGDSPYFLWGKNLQCTYCFYFQICVSSKMCLETVYSILGYWNYPLANILGDTGCHIANLLRLTGALETQLHSFIMSTTRYILLFHDNLLLRFNLTTNVSETICLHLNSNMTYSLLICT